MYHQDIKQAHAWHQDCFEMVEREFLPLASSLAFIAFFLINHRTSISSHLVMAASWLPPTRKNTIKTSVTPAGQYTRLLRAVPLPVYLVTATGAREMASLTWGTFLLNYIYILRPLPGEGQPSV